jgi:single-strand DNA-binding protein
MNKIFLSGRIASDIKTFGTDNSPCATFSFVTSKPKRQDGRTVKGENGYAETYNEFHNVKVFGGLAKAVANNKKKGDQLMIIGEVRYSKNEHEGRTFYNTDIVADEVEFV